MHKRSEVDMRVQQELKNHSDFVYETNQQLQNLNIKICELALKSDKSIAKLESDRKEVIISFDNLSDEVVKIFHRLTKRMGQLESQVSSVSESFQELKEDLCDKFLRKDDFQEIMLDYTQIFTALEDESKAREGSIDVKLRDLTFIIDDRIKALRSDICKELEKEDPYKQQVEDRLNIFEVDFDGLAREIEILKRSTHYDEKKFEYLATRIERLKSEL